MLLKILDSFDGLAAEPLTAAEIVAKSRLPRSSVFRALSTLRKAGYLKQDPVDRRYSLGPHVLQLGMVARRQLAVDDCLTPALLDLVRMTGETATFSVLDLPWRTCVAVVEAPSDLRQVVQVGARYPLNLGAAGKVLLAHLPPNLAKSLQRSYSLTGGNAKQLLSELQRIRTAGSVTTSGERVPGASAISAPVFVNDNIYGCVTVVGPTPRMSPFLERNKRLVIDQARSLSRLLSGRAAKSCPPRPQAQRRRTP